MSIGITGSIESIIISPTQTIYQFGLAYFEGNHVNQISLYNMVIDPVTGEKNYIALNYDLDYTIIETPNIISNTLMSIRSTDPNGLDRYRASEGIQLGGEIHLVNPLTQGELLVVRMTEPTQDIDFSGIKFPADTTEGSLDKVSFILQELRDELMFGGRLEKSNAAFKLNDLLDVVTPNLNDGDVLEYVAATNRFEPKSFSTGQAGKLEDLVNVNVSGQHDGDLLTYNQTTNRYEMKPKQETLLGMIISSMLTEAQMVSQGGAGWKLCDGSDCTGTKYAVLTNNITVPDLRGQFLRGLGGVDPDASTRTLGSSQSDTLKAHHHTYVHGSKYNTQGGGCPTGSHDTGRNTSTTGGAETRPKNIAVNYFIFVGV